MNITYLHIICKAARKEAAETFYIKVTNPLWELDESLIDIEIADMKQTIGQKVLGKLMDNNLYPAQIKVLESILESYIKLAVRVARNYAKKVSAS